MAKKPTDTRGGKIDTNSLADNKASSDGRRTALKVLTASGVVAGATVPISWKKPLVEGVVLPAHAQTTGCGTGNCNAGSATILAAEVLGSGALFVLGEYDAPPSCLVVTQATQVATESQSLVCHLISEGTTIGAESKSTAGNCTGASAIADGCLVSCSVVVDAGSHGITPGDCVTMRFTFGGSCVCSAVTTVSGA